MTDTTYAVGVWQQANLPNWLTASRVFLVIPVVMLSWFGFAWYAVGLIAVAGATDWLDGWLARRLALETPLGRVSDPIADKVFTDFALLAAAINHNSWVLLLIWVVALGYDVDNTWQRRKEIGRALLNLKGDKPDLPATPVSKSKTALLFVLLGLAYMPGHAIPNVALEGVAFVACGIVCYSWFSNRKTWLRHRFYNW